MGWKQFERADGPRACATGLILWLETGMKNIPLSLFFPGKPGEVPLGWEGELVDGNVPAVDVGFIFEPDLLRDIFVFLRDSGGDGMYLFGPTGAGKSSVVQQVAARLGWPVWRVCAHQRMDLADLVGTYVLAKEDGATVSRWEAGPLVKAMKSGGIFLLDEVDLLDPGVAVGLNSVLEGAGVQTPEGWVSPHPLFRFVATANTNGLGDETARYQGAQVQNLASLDRFWVVRCDYPKPEAEAKLLLSFVSLEMAFLMAKLAAEVRGLFVKGELSAPISTRALIRWARIYRGLGGAPVGNRLEYALKRAVLNRLPHEEADGVLKIAQAVFGEEWR